MIEAAKGLLNITIYSVDSEITTESDVGIAIIQIMRMVKCRDSSSNVVDGSEDELTLWT